MRHGSGSRRATKLVCCVPALLVAAAVFAPISGYCQDVESQDDSPQWESPLQKAMTAWENWPPSENFKITVEYRNYTYFNGSNRGDDRNSINDARLRIEYDRNIADNMRLYIDTLFEDDDDEYVQGYIDDFEDDDPYRNHFNFNEAFLDIYFSDFDLRLGKQIVTWGKADVSNPTDNINPTDYSNLADDETIGVVAANLSYYWNDWNLQIVGIPGFTPTRLPPAGTWFGLVPPDGFAIIEDPRLPFDLQVPIEDPDLPANTIDNSQYGVRLKTTHDGWDFSVSFYDGVNDFPTASIRYADSPFPIPEAIVPVYHRFRAIGGDFATTFDRWGFHGEGAYLVFDGDAEDSRMLYVLGLDYTKSNVLFDHDIFIILEYVGETVTREGEGLVGESALDRVLVNTVAGNIRYEFTDYTKIEFRGLVDFYQGNDFYLQPILIHQFTDNFEIAVGFDLFGGPGDTFFGQFDDNDRVFVKLKYTF